MRWQPAYFYFRRALGRVKNERKEETNHIGRKRRHICLLFASVVFFVCCLLLLAIIVNMKCFCVYLTLGWLVFYGLVRGITWVLFVYDMINCL